MPRKKLLILGAGYYYKNIFKEIRELDYYLLTVDRSPDSPGFQLVDEHSVIDIVDREKVLQYAREKQIDGIMPVNDFGVRTACFVSQELGLIGNTLATGICCNDKGIMRDVWKSENLNQPRFVIIKPDKKELARVMEEFPFPLVVKPTDCGGAGRGISIASNPIELSEAFDYALPYAKNHRIIVEQYIEGTEMTIESLSYKGQVYILSMSDKFKPEQRYRVATGLHFPPKFSSEILDQVKLLVSKAVKAVGITNGAAHTEVIVEENGSPKLVEIGARGGGGHVFHTIVKENLGINYPQEFAKILCGEVPSIIPTKNNGVVYRFFNPQPGIIKDIVIPNEIHSLPYLVDFGITAQKGQRFDGLKDSLHRVGFVVTRGKTREEAILHADHIEKMITFVIE